MSDRPLIGLIGFGAIGREIVAILSGEYRFAVVLRSGSRTVTSLPDSVIPVASDGSPDGAASALADLRPALVVEAAGVDALAQFAPPLLERGIDLVAASTGALADPLARSALMTAAAQGGARLIVPAGALGGLDYLGALGDIEDARVTYTSRKPPSAWAGELAALGRHGDRIERAVTLFEGTAEDAARLYPKNLNAGLTLALAVGSHRLRVRVVADPTVRLNTHEIEAESAAGSAFLRFANRPSDRNPKTSAITAHSLAAAVRRRFSALVV